MLPLIKSEKMRVTIKSQYFIIRPLWLKTIKNHWALIPHQDAISPHGGMQAAALPWLLLDAFQLSPSWWIRAGDILLLTSALECYKVYPWLNQSDRK
jgi:hypothetical protein